MSSSSSSSSSNPDPWSPYETYKDCSLGICSRYCPQWCYVIFPPPPPDNEDSSSDGLEFSPLVIAVIGILASAFLLVTYYALVSRYCRRRPEPARTGEVSEPAGLEEALIKSIRVCKYKKSDLSVEGTDCSVCLSEFVEDESLRLLPKCNHAFHIPCIDAWLKNQATCPLCRSTLNPLPLRPAHTAPFREDSRSVSSPMQHRPASDVVVLVRQLERVVLISDILEIEQDGDGDGEVGSVDPGNGSLSTIEIGEGESKSGVKVKTSRSVDRCKFTRHGKNGSSAVIYT